MEETTDIIREKTEELFNLENFEDVIKLLTDKVLETLKNAELYIWRGNAWYIEKVYDNAIADYNKAIEINPNYEIAFYNRGLVWVAKKEYDKAIADYSKAIEINPNYEIIFYNRGVIWVAKKKYDKAINDYNKVIELNPDFADAYYNRGLAKKEIGNKLHESIKDIKKYLELTTKKDDIWTRLTKDQIEELQEQIKNKELNFIANLITKIKDLLLIKEECITHYSSLSVLKSLILDCSKFRISEGNFMNDPSEGTEFFNFLKYKPYIASNDGSLSVSFSPKPFIGSFVTKDKYDDLNMWRFYGKEEGVEAKGCAITLRTQEFIEDINNSILKGEEDSLKYESDINFYRVAYLANGSTNFYIPSSDKSEELTKLMTKLKKKVKSYKVKDRTSLEKYLNSIAFLFKSDAYKNENEVRLVVKGIEFEKKYNMNITPPRVYIELESIKKIVEQITLGPKVDKADEWASAFHYSYKENAPPILISHLPYK